MQIDYKMRILSYINILARFIKTISLFNQQTDINVRITDESLQAHFYINKCV